VEEEEILSMFKCIESQFGHVDILINNAAIGVLGDLVDGQTDAWRQMFQVSFSAPSKVFQGFFLFLFLFQLNILATSICIRETLKLLEKDGIDNGHIININR
jgi:NAD(P)-dependent dehydrogenase (short-subunit alcohol dehydrogenase family)